MSLISLDLATSNPIAYRAWLKAASAGQREKYLSGLAPSEYARHLDGLARAALEHWAASPVRLEAALTRNVSDYYELVSISMKGSKTSADRDRSSAEAQSVATMIAAFDKLDPAKWQPVREWLHSRTVDRKLAPPAIRCCGRFFRTHGTGNPEQRLTELATWFPSARTIALNIARVEPSYDRGGPDVGMTCAMAFLRSEEMEIELDLGSWDYEQYEELREAVKLLAEKARAAFRANPERS